MNSEHILASCGLSRADLRFDIALLDEECRRLDAVAAALCQCCAGIASQLPLLRGVQGVRWEAPDVQRYLQELVTAMQQSGAGAAGVPLVFRITVLLDDPLSWEAVHRRLNTDLVLAARPCACVEEHSPVREGMEQAGIEVLDAPGFSLKYRVKLEHLRPAGELHITLCTAAPPSGSDDRMGERIEELSRQVTASLGSFESRFEGVVAVLTALLEQLAQQHPAPDDAPLPKGDSPSAACSRERTTSSSDAPVDVLAQPASAHTPAQAGVPADFDPDVRSGTTPEEDDESVYEPVQHSPSVGEEATGKEGATPAHPSAGPGEVGGDTRTRIPEVRINLAAGVGSAKPKPPRKEELFATVLVNMDEVRKKGGESGRTAEG